LNESLVVDVLSAGAEVAESARYQRTHAASGSCGASDHRLIAGHRFRNIPAITAVVPTGGFAVQGLQPKLGSPRLGFLNRPKDSDGGIEFAQTISAPAFANLLIGGVGCFFGPARLQQHQKRHKATETPSQSCGYRPPLFFRCGQERHFSWTI
jgi:hypothetical protein